MKVMYKLFFLLIFLFNLRSYSQDYYKITVDEMIKNKEKYHTGHKKLKFDNTTTGKKTDYLDIAFFIKDTSLVKRIYNYRDTIFYNEKTENITVSEKYLSKNKFDAWKFDNYLIFENKIYLTATMIYKNKRGGRNLLVIIDGEKITKIFNEGFVY